MITENPDETTGTEGDVVAAGGRLVPTPVPESAAAVEAREELLKAIAREADEIFKAIAREADALSGRPSEQNPAALERLAHAYALVAAAQPRAPKSLGATTASSRSTLGNEEWLLVGNSLFSADGSVEFKCQGDGKVAIYWGGECRWQNTKEQRNDVK